MPRIISGPTEIECVGTEPKLIREFIGRANSGHTELSLAHMISPEGWSEPGQRPEFAEYTYVLKGRLKLTLEDGEIEVTAGQVVETLPGEWVQYSTPFPGGAEYVAVCLPAFSPDTVHRDDE